MEARQVGPTGEGSRIFVRVFRLDAWTVGCVG